MTENTETSRARHTLFSLCGLLLHLHVDLAPLELLCGNVFAVISLRHSALSFL